MLYAFPVLSIFPEQKSFLQDVRHNLWDFDQDEDEVAVANMAAKFRNIYHKVRCADCENVF